MLPGRSPAQPDAAAAPALGLVSQTDSGSLEQKIEGWGQTGFSSVGTDRFILTSQPLKKSVFHPTLPISLQSENSFPVGQFVIYFCLVPQHFYLTHPLFADGRKLRSVQQSGAITDTQIIVAFLAAVFLFASLLVLGFRFCRVVSHSSVLPTPFIYLVLHV